MATKYPTGWSNPGLILLVSYLTLFVTNSLILWLANTLFPEQVVLGTVNIPYWWALGLSMGVLTAINTAIIPLVQEWEGRNQATFTNSQWLGLYLIINAVSLWGIGRFAEIFGLGVASWVVVLSLAVAMTLAQGVSMMALGRIIEEKTVS